MTDKAAQTIINQVSDLSIFDDKQQAISDSKCDSPSSYLSCINVKRLLFTLKYYQTLQVPNNKNGKEIFNNFVINNYKYKIYDDFNHFTKYHQPQLEDVKQYAINNYNLAFCDLNECKYADRHYKVDENRFNNINNDDEHDMISEVYIETMDSFHFYLMHLYQSSLRIISNTTKTEEKQNNNNDPYFDPELHRFSQEIKTSRSITKRFNRLNVTNNKYNIFIANGNQQQQTYELNDIDDDIKIDCYLDYVFKKLSSNVIVTKSIQNFINDQEYDTESVDFDLNIFDVDSISNISHHVCNDAAVQEMSEIFKESKSVYVFVFLQCPSIHLLYTLFLR